MAVTKTPRKKAAPAPKADEALDEQAKAKPATTRKPRTKASTLEAPAEATPATRKSAKVKVPVPAEPSPAMLAVPEAMPTPQSTRPSAKAAAKGPGLPPLASSLLLAIQEGRAVEFIFQDAETYAPRTFEPRHLTFDALSQAWYVWGWDRRYNAERHHRVDLLAEVNEVEGVGRAAQGPYAEGTPANQIGGWLGGEPIAVKVSLLKQWVFAVKQAPPAFPAFHLEDQGDGQALVTFTATDLRAIARWVMQFGDGIQVLEPARLVDRVKQVGAVWAGRDRQSVAPAAAPKPAPRPEAEPQRAEARHHREARPEREARPHRETERDEPAAKGKPGKVEVIRFDRL